MRDGLPKIYPRLWRYGLVLSGDPTVAEDLAQTTALRALEKSSGYTPGTRLDRWLMTMLHRLWLNERRSAAVRRAGGLVSVDDIDIPDGSADTETNILAREVFAKVMKLPEAQRGTVVLVYVEGFSYREASEFLDVPIGTVMSRLAGARKTLAEANSEDVRHVL